MRPYIKPIVTASGVSLGQIAIYQATQITVGV